MKKYGYIYKITHIPSGRYYIGQHRSEVFDEKYWGNGRVIKDMYKKYSLEEFSREVLAWAKTQEELNSLEEYYIGDKFEKDIKCLNLKSGGEGHEFSEETKRKISVNHADFSGDKNPMYGVSLESYWKGKHLSEEARKKISEANKGHTHSEELKEEYRKRFSGINNPFYGKHHSEETIKILKEKCGRPWSEENKKRMSKFRKGKPSPAKGKHWKVKDTSNYRKAALKRWRNRCETIC